RPIENTLQSHERPSFQPAVTPRHRPTRSGSEPDSLAASGGNYWPPPGRTEWPLTPVVADPKITYGAGIYFNATGAEWTSYGIAAGSVGYFANVAGCAFTDKIPNVGLKRAATAICSAVGYKTLKDWGAFLENEINNSSCTSWACYQTKLAPRNGRLTEVSAGNCK
ncbi:hypothetical protein ACFXKW_38470, partial [Streptomyces sp. NPDC059193]